jgi:hypothetical protein
MSQEQKRIAHYNKEIAELQNKIAKIALEEMTLDSRKRTITAEKDNLLDFMKHRMEWREQDQAILNDQKRKKTAQKKRTQTTKTKTAKKTTKKQAKKSSKR